MVLNAFIGVCDCEKCGCVCEGTMEGVSEGWPLSPPLLDSYPPSLHVLVVARRLSVWGDGVRWGQGYHSICPPQGHRTLNPPSNSSLLLSILLNLDPLDSITKSTHKFTDNTQGFLYKHSTLRGCMCKVGQSDVC